MLHAICISAVAVSQRSDISWSKEKEILLKEAELKIKEEELRALKAALPKTEITLTTMKSAKEQEFEKKEAYLRQLQEELNAKENQISATIRSEATLNPYSKVAASKAEISHLIKPYVNPFSGVEPTPRNESSFEVWKLETEWLIGSGMYPDYIVTQSIRSFLKGHARQTLVTLGPTATSQEIINKLETVFGNVASGESALQEFYTASQKADESVTM